MAELVPHADYHQMQSLEARTPWHVMSDSPLHPITDDQEAVIAVTAAYITEQESLAAFALLGGEPFQLSDFHARYRQAFEDTPYGRAQAQRDRLAQANTPPKPDGEPNFNDLMAEYTTAPIRREIKTSFWYKHLSGERVQLEEATTAALGAAATDVSVEQAHWEIRHGMGRFGGDAKELIYSHDPELGGSTKKIHRVWGAVSKAFIAYEGEPVSPAQLARHMDLAPGIASPMLSALVADGILIRDVGNNTLAPSALMAPRPYQLAIHRVMQRVVPRRRSRAEE